MFLRIIQPLRVIAVPVFAAQVQSKDNDPFRAHQSRDMNRRIGGIPARADGVLPVAKAKAPAIAQDADATRHARMNARNLFNRTAQSAQQMHAGVFWLDPKRSIRPVDDVRIRRHAVGRIYGNPG